MALKTDEDEMMKNTVIKVVLMVALTGIVGVVTQTNAAGNSPAKTPVLVELFTSEGCSSCPPADRLLETLDEKQPFPGAELIVLSEHVDYWNGEGWADPYSSRLYSERQHSYAEQFNLDSVYTPQVVVDGARETVGSNAAGIRNAVAAVARGEKVALHVLNPVRERNRINFNLTSGDLPNDHRSATLYVAIAENKVRSNVARGENGGRSLTHVAVVRLLSPVATVKAGSSFSKEIVIPMPSQILSTEIRVVAFLQDGKSRKILGVTEETL